MTVIHYPILTERAAFRVWDYVRFDGHSAGTIICAADCERREPGYERHRTDFAAPEGYMVSSEQIRARYVEEAEQAYRRRFTVPVNFTRCPCASPVLNHERYLAEHDAA